MADTNNPEEEKIEVNASLLKSILKKQEELEANLKIKDDQITQLQYAADKGRMGIFESRNAKGELIPTYAVGFWPISDKKSGETVEYMVRGTKMIFQDVVIEDNGGVRRLVENQILRVFLDQGDDKQFKEIDMPYVNFYRQVRRKRFPAIKSSETEDGHITKILRMEDGREVEFDVNFLNY